jgi:hypothetical protein
MRRFGTRTAIQLRLTESRNHQTIGINWAREFEFAVTLRALGP